MENRPNFLKRFFLSFAVAFRFLFNSDFAARVLTVLHHPELLPAATKHEGEPALPGGADATEGAKALEPTFVPKEAMEREESPAAQNGSSASAQRSAQESKAAGQRVSEGSREEGRSGPEAAAKESGAALQLLALLQREGRLVDFLMEDIAAFPDADIGAAARVVHEGCRKALDDFLKLEPVFAQSEGDSVVVKEGFDPREVRLTGNIAGNPPFSGVLRHHGWKAASLNLPQATSDDDHSVLAPAEVEL